MEKKEIKNILINSVNSFDNINHYEMIGTFGSINSNSSSFGDIDLVSIGGDKVHKKFLKYLSNEFLKNQIKIKFFKTILKKPSVKENELLIHDLHYIDLSDLLNREWKVIIISMKNDIETFYGKNLLNNFSKLEVSKSDLFNPILKWVNNINNKREYNIFISHLMKYNLDDFYEYKFENYGDKIKDILNSKSNWKNKISQIKEVLTIK